MKKRVPAGAAAAALIFCIFLLLGVFAPAASAAGLSTGADRYDRMAEIIELIMESGVNSSETDDPLRRALEALFEDPDAFSSFMNAMLGSYDPYSSYVPTGLYSQYFPIPEPYVGVGIEMDPEMRGGLYVKSVVPGSPAAEAGVLAGDRISGVDGKDAAGWTQEELIARVRGDEGSEVRLTAARYGEAEDLAFSLTRTALQVEEIAWEDLGGGTALVRIPQFASLTTVLQFFDVYAGLPERGIDRVVFDLRGNPGGEVTVYLHILNLVVNAEGLPLLTLRGRDGAARPDALSELREEGWTPEAMVVLIDAGTASAAELFAGTLRDYGYAELVGDVSYGKGYMQSHVSFDEGDVMVLSTQEVLLPRSGSYDGVGLVPDYEIAMGSRPFSMPTLPTLPTSVSRGAPADRVKTLQTCLSLLRYYNGIDDGLWNETLLYALNAYQRDNGLEETDDCGGLTMSRIRLDINRLKSTSIPVDTQLAKALEAVQLK